MKKLVRNRIKCRNCGDIIESKHVNDFVVCKCKSIAVDGGLEYARYIYLKEEYLDRSYTEYEDENGVRVEED